ncbi:MAG: hypothetical protein QW831_06855 [Candidatus Jordarchaeaceae archaeon]
MNEEAREPGDTELQILARHIHSLTKRLTQVKLKAWWLLYNPEHQPAENASMTCSAKQAEPSWKNTRRRNWRR